MAGTRERLEAYRRKRDFSRTPEPASARRGRPGPGRRFVVQRHRARRLHYDFRLEVDGVLVSWAVPKGPTLDPKSRRVAIMTEDHPLEYYDFEGVIPAGEYGAGDVIVWDHGTWAPADDGDPAGALARGELHFDLTGQKLRGRFVLVRSGGGSGDRDQWLLLHKRDPFAAEGWDAEDHPESVLSGRTSDEVRADPDRLWRSDLPVENASVPLTASTRDSVAPDALAQLDELGASGRWLVFDRELRVTSLDQERCPGVTKRDLLRYAAQVAPVVLPYLSGRALDHRRPTRAPDWLGRSSDEASAQVVVDEPAALLWAVNAGVVEWRTGTARVDKPDEPTWAVVDIGAGTWDDVLVLARLYRTAVEHLRIVARAKLSGLGGIQVWVPLTRGPGFRSTRAWVAGLARAVGDVAPEVVRDARLPDAQDRAVVVPYSPRLAPGAPVSTPIEWVELDDPSLSPRGGLTIATVPRRVEQAGDLFADVLHSGQRLPPLR